MSIVGPAAPAAGGGKTSPSKVLGLLSRPRGELNPEEDVEREPLGVNIFFQMQGLKRERENDELMQFMFLAQRKLHILVPTSSSAVATARALVENPKRLEHYVNQMPFELFAQFDTRHTYAHCHVVFAAGEQLLLVFGVETLPIYKGRQLQGNGCASSWYKLNFFFISNV